jgi:hypothetical protein
VNYFDLNIRHFHEKLREEHKIELHLSAKSAASSAPGAEAAKARQTRAVERSASDARNTGKYAWRQILLVENPVHSRRL